MHRQRRRARSRTIIVAPREDVEVQLANLCPTVMLQSTGKDTLDRGNHLLVRLEPGDLDRPVIVTVEGVGAQYSSLIGARPAEDGGVSTHLRLLRPRVGNCVKLTCRISVDGIFGVRTIKAVDNKASTDDPVE